MQRSPLTANHLIPSILNHFPLLFTQGEQNILKHYGTINYLSGLTNLNTYSYPKSYKCDRWQAYRNDRRIAITKASYISFNTLLPHHK